MDMSRMDIARVRYLEASSPSVDCEIPLTQTEGLNAMTNGESPVVLGSMLSALIVCLHNEGILSAGTVRDQLEAGIEFQPEHREVLSIAVQRVRLLADALAPFEPKIPSTTQPNQTD